MQLSTANPQEQSPQPHSALSRAMTPPGARSSRAQPEPPKPQRWLLLLAGAAEQELAPHLWQCPSWSHRLPLDTPQPPPGQTKEIQLPPPLLELPAPALTAAPVLPNLAPVSHLSPYTSAPALRTQHAATRYLLPTWAPTMAVGTMLKAGPWVCRTARDGWSIPETQHCFLAARKTTPLS